MSNMNKTKDVRIARDALIIEAIGEVNVLIQRLGELEDKTAPFVINLESKLIELISRVDNQVTEQQMELAAVSEREKKLFQQKLNASVAKTVNRMVMQRADGLSVRSQVLIALTIAITASAISVYGSYRLFGREQDEQAAIGRAVMVVWNELDERSKSKIEQAY